MKISFLKVINYIKKNNIQDVYFVDSYGGIKKFFDLLEQFNQQRKFIILCSNIEVFKFLSSLKIYKKNIFYYSTKDLLLKNFIIGIIFIPLRIFFKQVDRIFCYKLITDPFRFFLINLISSEKTKIYVSDQFYKFYNFSENKNFKKNFFIALINLFYKIKLRVYGHLEFQYDLYPCLDKKYNFISLDNNWKFYKQKFFKSKNRIKNNSLIIIDETINLLIENNWIITKNFSNNLQNKINNFLKKYNIKNIYYKPHPTSKIGSYLINNLNLKSKIIYLDKKYPLEFFLDDFKYCIFSISSSLWFPPKTKLFSLNDVIKFKRVSLKKKYLKLFKKNIGNSNFKNI